MRRGWHKWWLVAAAATGCSLDPQPSLPVTPASGGQYGAGGSSINVGDNPGTGTGNTGNALNTGAGGAGDTAGPDAGRPRTPGAAGETGEAGASNEGGAAGESGAAGSVVR